MNVKHRWMAILLTVLMLLLCGCGTNTGNDVSEQPPSETGANLPDELPDTEALTDTEQTGIPQQYAAVVYVTINPELALYLNADGRVIAAECLNEDATEVFSEISLDDLSVEEAMNTVVETAVDKGFLTEGKTVHIEVEQEEGETVSAEELTEKIEQAVITQLEEEEVAAEVALSIDGEEYVSSVEIPSPEPQKELCEACGGTGICPECGGGTLACKRCGGSLWESCGICNGSGKISCHGCHGSGKETSQDGTVYEDPCHHCGGSGTMTCDLCGGAGGKSCSICNGTGHMGADCIVCHGDKTCTACGGTGEK